MYGSTWLQHNVWMSSCVHPLGYITVGKWPVWVKRGAIVRTLVCASKVSSYVGACSQMLASMHTYVPINVCTYTGCLVGTELGIGGL